MTNSWPYPDFDAPDVEPDAPSLSLIAKWHDEGRTCGECGAQFTQAHGEPVACDYCSRRGSEYPRAEFPEVNKEAHRREAKRRKQRKAE